LDRSHEKLREKILKLKQKGQYQKARQALEEASVSTAESPELAAEAIGLSFQLDAWKETLELLRTHLEHHSLAVLCGGENREAFLELLHEHGGFAGGLTHLLMSARDYEGIVDWVRLSDDYDQRWLIRQWLQTAQDYGNEPLRAAMLLAAAGVGLFLLDDWDGAWSKWEQALELEPRLLKKLMAFCQQPGRLESSRLEHRLRLIRLIAASGKKNETLSLLKAVGLESGENAKRVLEVIPDLFMEDIAAKDVVTLRYSLAMSLRDPEILTEVIASMSELNESDLFRYKKLAMTKLEDPTTKRRVMTAFVRLYFDREEWESAGLLLESLYIESPHQELITLMEKVLDHYPIMSQLHFTAGKHYLDLERYDRAVYHLGTIQQVEEYESELRGLLEAHLGRVYESTLAEMLLGMLDPNSHKAGLIAYWILDNEVEETEKHLSLWAQPKLTDQSSPFWTLALVNALVRQGKHTEAAPFAANLIQGYPMLGPELLFQTEEIALEMKGDATALTRAIEDNLDRLQPRNHWSNLRMRFIDATETFRNQQTRQPVAPPDMPEPGKESMAPEMKNQFGHFKALLDSGNFQGAADLALQVVRDTPRAAGNVLRYLDALWRQFPQQSIWIRTMLQILNGLGQHAKAVELGTRAMAAPGIQADLPEIYQHLSESYEGQGNGVESFRFLCLASRLPRLYERNAAKLAEKVLPHMPQYLKDVVQLVLINEDQETWELLTKHWYQHRPEDLEQLIKAQRTFTNQMGSTQAILDLAYWYLQANQAEEVTQTLNQLDLEDPEILDSLTKIANLTALKFPDDPKPKFLLGKYYLVQGEIDKAVDTFRDLAAQAPHLAETVYHHLRTFLRQNPLSTNKLRLYGLLIRFALDYGSPLAAVRLLDEYGRQDRAGAQGLVDGVHRVLLRKKGNVEATYELMKMLFRWTDFEKLLEMHGKSAFGTHMADERFRWFEEIRTTHPTLANRANLAMAELYYETFSFDKCRNSLSQIMDQVVKRDSLEIYRKLCTRFPNKLEIWREAGWAAFLLDNGYAEECFTNMLDSDDLEARVEAFAILTELGRKPERTQLAAAEEEKLLSALQMIYQRIRSAELEVYENNEEPVPGHLLIWMIENDRLEEMEALLPRLAGGDAHSRVVIDALVLWWTGRREQAAWRVSGSKPDPRLERTLFDLAGLAERAVAVSSAGRLPAHMRERFTRTYGKPELIRPTFDHQRRLQRLFTLGVQQGEVQR